MSPTAATTAARIAEIVGTANATSDPAQLAAYRIGSILPAGVVRPGSSEEVAEIIKFAAAERLALVACGARTKLDMGAPPRQYDVAIDMTRLNRVIAYDPGDLTLSVEPGVPLSHLEDALAKHRQSLPLGVPFMDRATVGGTIASGVDSPLRRFYGTPRDYVLGMEFVTGEGTPRKSGGRVVKNVSGYDLHKLMIGTLGSLGIITKINFRTFPMPAAVHTIVAEFSSPVGALDLRRRLAHSALRPLTVEILSPRAGGLLGSSASASNSPWTFISSFAGTAKLLDRAEQDMRRMARECHAESLTSHDEPSLVLGASARTREFVPAVLNATSAATILKLGVLATHIEEALDIASKAADAAELVWAALARGVGVIYFALLPGEENPETLARAVEATSRIVAKCATLGGHATIPWCPAEWKKALPIWGQDRADFEQMRKLKAVFDPQGIFASGRFAGGI